jgi:cytosine deaminase
MGSFSPGDSLESIGAALRGITPDPRRRHDPFALVVLEEALAAAGEGNYGIGACLVLKETGEVVLRGRNRVFKPFHRKDRHAEIDVLTEYGKTGRGAGPAMNRLVLFSSIEPCPMCLGRIAASGVGEVFYLASDSESRMAYLRERRPGVWKEIAGGGRYGPADCSPALSRLALEIFLISTRELDGWRNGGGME